MIVSLMRRGDESSDTCPPLARAFAESGKTAGEISAEAPTDRQKHWNIATS